MLSGKNCLITGGSRGMGKAIACAFAKEQANLALVARSQDALDAAAEECKSLGAVKVETFTVDLGDPAAVDALAKDALASFGCIDVLVNNAGIVPSGTAQTGEPDEWDKGIITNLGTPMRLTRRFSPHMVEKEEGAIINISSTFGVEASGDAGVYSATKFGLRGWSHACFENLGKHNVKVSCINPGPVDTDMTKKYGGARERFLVAEDVAEAAMMVIRTSSQCCPSDLTLKANRNPWG